MGLSLNIIISEFVLICYIDKCCIGERAWKTSTQKHVTLQEAITNNENLSEKKKKERIAVTCAVMWNKWTQEYHT